jgi:hypothetical protein
MRDGRHSIWHWSLQYWASHAMSVEPSVDAASGTWVAHWFSQESSPPLLQFSTHV